MVNEKDLNILLSRFAIILSGSFELDCIYLFGSYSIKNATEESDIDVAVVSKDFEGNRFKDRNKVAAVIIDATYPNLEFAGFEIHPFKSENFTNDDPFVEEIKKTGKRIY
ncbi:MAG: nucleotidyltransferase domain-containing protein [Bacteroidetes bacterium]|nr:nucleotidyltransferase domain-containing protein [Bacteroidota bacterium]